ncbi:hypothetical protein V8G54_024324 [Vigna mungo]|uniref:Transmembrane protein n=1 Tax=Vigna mungo TaxID=3915 RepID=A0AAQ3N5D4_VIGMU
MARHFSNGGEEGLVLHSAPIFLFLMIIASLSIISIIIFACGDDNKITKRRGGGTSVVTVVEGVAVDVEVMAEVAVEVVVPDAEVVEEVGDAEVVEEVGDAEVVEEVADAEVAEEEVI